MASSHPFFVGFNSQNSQPAALIYGQSGLKFSTSVKQIVWPARFAPKKAGLNCIKKYVLNCQKMILRILFND
jgi:hypothetical protein